MTKSLVEQLSEAAEFFEGPFSVKESVLINGGSEGITTLLRQAKAEIERLEKEVKREYERGCVDGEQSYRDSLCPCCN